MKTRSIKFLCLVLFVYNLPTIHGYKKDEIRIGTYENNASPLIHVLIFGNACIMLLSIILFLSKAGLFDQMSEDQSKVFQFAAESINQQRADVSIRDDEEPSALLPWHELVADSTVIADDQFMISRSVCELLEKGIVGLFGPTAGQSSGYVQSMCDLMEIPHIETRRDHLPNRGTCMLNLHPYPPTLARVYADLVRAMKWTSFTILFDTDDSLPRINELLKLYDPKGYSVIVRKLDIYNSDGNFRPILKEAKDNNEHHFILESTGYDLFTILTQAQQVGILSDHYHYIITTLDMHTIDLEPFQYGGANITGVRMVDPDDEDVEQATMLWREFEQERGETLRESLEKEKLTLDTALMYDAVFIFAEALHQLNQSNSIKARPIDCDEMDNWEHGYSLINFMRMVNWKGLTGILKFDHQGFRTDFMLQILELTSDGLQKIGTWNSTEGLNITRTQVPYHESEQVTNLQNRTFIVLTALSKPYGMLKDSALKLTGNDRYEGFGIDVIHELSLLLGFNYSFEIQEDNNYGSINSKTGEWEGMLREVMDKRADLAITDLTITSQRESVVDFTMPFMNLGISILYKKAKKMPPEMFSFMAPFSKELWYYMGAAYFSVSFLIFLMGRLSPYEWMNPYPCIEEPESLSNQFSLTNSFWFTIGSLLQQGSEIAPAATSTRIAAGTWWFFTLIMVSSYTANLAACLTVERLFEPIKSAEDLAAQTQIQYGSKAKGSTKDFFKEATYPPFKKMFEYMENTPNVMFGDNDSGVQRVKNTNYAFLMESTSIEYITQRDCDLQQVGGLLDDKGYGIAMRKNSTYRNALSTAVLRLQEAGKLQKLKDKWWKEKRGGGACEDTGAAAQAAELGLPHVGGVFIVLVTGILCSTVTAFLEMSFGAVSRSFKYKIPLREEIFNELKFLIRCSGLTKPVRTSSEEDNVDGDGGSRKSDDEKNGFDDLANDIYNYVPDLSRSNDIKHSI